MSQRTGLDYRRSSWDTERLKAAANATMLNHKHVIMLSNVLNVETLIAACVKMR